MEAKIKEKSTNATNTTGEDDLLEGEGSGDDTTTLATGLVDLNCDKLLNLVLVKPES